MTKDEFKQAYQALGLTDSKLAKAIGLSDRTIRRYKSGEWLVNEQTKIILNYMLYSPKPAYNPRNDPRSCQYSPDPL